MGGTMAEMEDLKIHKTSVPKLSVKFCWQQSMNASKILFYILFLWRFRFIWEIIYFPSYSGKNVKQIFCNCITRIDSVLVFVPLLPVIRCWLPYKGVIPDKAGVALLGKGNFLKGIKAEDFYIFNSWRWNLSAHSVHHS